MAIMTEIPIITAAGRTDLAPLLEAWPLLFLSRLAVKSWRD
jgi:hypothetical protein